MPYKRERGFRLNAMCTRDENLWRIKCPMICFYAVEWHLPQRVASQYGRRQRTPPASQSTSVDLHRLVLECPGKHFICQYELLMICLLFVHRIDRKRCPKVKEWDSKHSQWIEMWNNREKYREMDGTMVRHSEYMAHLAWHEEQHRLKLKPTWTTQDCLDLGTEDGDNEYNLAVKESAGTSKDYAPVFNRVVRHQLSLNLMCHVYL